MRGISLFFVFLLFFLTVFSCSSGVSAFQFDDLYGKKIRLSESPGLDKKKEGLLDPANSIVKTSIYQFSRPVLAVDDSMGFFISLEGSLRRARLILFFSTMKESAAYNLVLPDTQKKVTLSLPLPTGTEINGFQIDTEETLGVCRIAAVGTEPVFYGMENLQNEIRMTLGMEYETSGLVRRSEHIRFPELEQFKEGMTRIRYRYSVPEGAPALQTQDVPVKMTVYAGNGENIFSFSPRAGTHDIYFQPGLLGFVAQGIVVTPEIDGLEVLALAQQALPASTRSPIPADFGTIIGYPKKSWRNKNFEVFSWNLYPEVLIFDTANYEVQSRMFTRLAYFVEKKGYAGQIIPAASLSYLHGWNAHDYRPQDLADFFTALPVSDRLPEEEIVLDVLEQNGIISQAGSGTWVAGKGAVLSVSRETPLDVRKKLLTHESFHGIFFVDEDFALSAQSLWQSLPEVEAFVWKHYFEYMSYDPTNDYLMANEYMAYLLQQPLEEVRGYFQLNAFPRYYYESQDYQGSVLQLNHEDPSWVLNAARAMENMSLRLTGLPAGYSPELWPLDR